MNLIYPSSSENMKNAPKSNLKEGLTSTFFHFLFKNITGE